MIGVNARTHRRAHGVTLDDVAREARRLGLKWTSSRAGDFEGGRVAATLATVVVAAGAYSAATSEPLTVSAMLATDERIEVTPVVRMQATRLVAILGGDDPTPVAGDLWEDHETAAIIAQSSDRTRDASAKFPDVLGSTAAEIEKSSGLATSRVAADLGTTSMMIVLASAHLWGHSVEDERDRRAGLNASPQKRGHVMRALKAELSSAIATGGVVDDER